MEPKNGSGNANCVFFELIGLFKLFPHNRGLATYDNVSVLPRGMQALHCPEP